MDMRKWKAGKRNYAGRCKKPSKGKKTQAQLDLLEAQGPCESRKDPPPGTAYQRHRSTQVKYLQVALRDKLRRMESEGASESALLSLREELSALPTGMKAPW